MFQILKTFLPKFLNLVIKSKNKIAITTISILLLVIVSLFVFFQKNFVYWLPKQAKENTMEVLVRSSKIDKILSKKIEQLKSYHCTAIGLFQYHNGIFLKSGNPLLKSTITNLVVSSDYKEVWDIPSLQAVSLTIFGNDFLKLVKNKIYVFQKDDLDISFSVKSRLYFTKSETAISVIIENKSGEPIGNLSFYFSKKLENLEKDFFKGLSEELSFELVGHLRTLNAKSNEQ